MFKYFNISSKLSKVYLQRGWFHVCPSINYCKPEEKCDDKNKTKDLCQLIRNNFHVECEEGLNEQINCELYASYTYYCMATCLSRPDVALMGFSKFFSAASREEQEHAQVLTDFVNMRGGSVQLLDIIKPEPADYQNPEVALEESIALEKNILKNIEELHKKACDHNDLLLSDLLESQFIPEQYKGLEQLAQMLCNLRRVGPGVGLVLLDQEMLRNPPSSHGGK